MEGLDQPAVAASHAPLHLGHQLRSQGVKHADVCVEEGGAKGGVEVCVPRLAK